MLAEFLDVRFATILPPLGEGVHVGVLGDHETARHLVSGRAGHFTHSASGSSGDNKFPTAVYDVPAQLCDLSLIGRFILNIDQGDRVCWSLALRM